MIHVEVFWTVKAEEFGLVGSLGLLRPVDGPADPEWRQTVQRYPVDVIPEHSDRLGVVVLTHCTDTQNQN